MAVRAVTDDYCIDFYRQHQLNLGKRHLCAGGVEGFDTCSGDSGAPLMGYDEQDPFNRAWYLAGVVSFGPGNIIIRKKSFGIIPMLIQFYIIFL